jgi:D-serine deaminase-like pyridoxal phosphate-dependent protein
MTETESGRWYEVSNIGEVTSPALLLYPARIEENIRRMIRIAGGPDRLRPHVKTHKTAEIVRLQMQQGIGRFKCATIAEAEMAAACGAADVLLAMQPVGPAVPRFLALMRQYPSTTLAAIVDSEPVIDDVARAAASAGLEATLWLDVNSGMNRTGVPPGAEAIRLYRMICARQGLRAGGLHVYDGHIHDSDLAARTRRCDDEFAPVQTMIGDLRAAGLPVPAVVAGGTPTFPVHARRSDVELSPGTTLLWDHGYGSAYPDLDFLPAAVLATRVVSRPAANLVCLDLGVKALASEMPQPRVSLFGMERCRIVAHNEEHLVVETPEADRYPPATILYGIPTHICPTVARYEAAAIVEHGRCTGEWPIVARNRRITI